MRTSSRLLHAVCYVGAACGAVLAMYCFFFNTTIFGVNTLVFEGTAVGLFLFKKGYDKDVRMLGLFSVGIVVAVFADPIIWALFKDNAPPDIVFSLKVNGFLASVIFISYVIGCFIRQKNIIP